VEENVNIFGKGIAAALGIMVSALPASAASVSPQPSVRAGCHLPVFGPGADYRPHFDRAAFTAHVDNPLFPLDVGRTLVYSGTKDGQKALDLFHISSRTLVVDGVRTRVVEDRLFLNGVLEERTSDYYAQDRCGNVWYFGEDTAELDAKGRVISTEGSFRAGQDGAQPGVYMQAHPQVGRRFRQEWYAGQAEDVFKVVKRSTPVTVPYGRFRHALRTAEQTALEPGVLDNKWYVAGIGEVVELAVKGPREKLVLVDILS
jgi:hypothetical protein